MKRSLRTAPLSLALLLGLGAAAHAQSPAIGPAGGPNLNRYLTAPAAPVVIVPSPHATLTATRSAPPSGSWLRSTTATRWPTSAALAGTTSATGGRFTISIV